jgi:hypothetical protein
MLMSFYAYPEGSTFSAWQRQKRISESVRTFANKTLLMNNIEMGEILIDDFHHSVTLMLEPPAAGHQLRISQLSFVSQ